MIKSEILKLIEGLKDTDDVNATILNTEEFKTAIKPDLNSMTVEDFKSMLDTNKVISAYYTSATDTKVSEGIKTFKSNQLPKLVEDEIAKRNNSNKTPEQIEFEKQRKEVLDMKKQLESEQLKSKYKDVLIEKKLDPKLLDLIISEDETKVTSNIDLLSSIIKDSTAAGIKEKLNESAYDPGKPASGNGGAAGKISWDQVLENPTLMADYQAQNK